MSRGGLAGCLLGGLLGVAGCAARTTVVPSPFGVAPAPEDAFSHHQWSRVAARYVQPSGRVDYAGLRQDPVDLNAYLAQLAGASPDSHPKLFATRDHQLAYWINAYNACVLKGVIDAYPIRSVQDVRPPGGFFTQFSYIIGGKPLTLAALRARIGRYGDPRAYLAINPGAVGGPRLPQAAFRGDTLQGDLDGLTREFVAHPKNVSVTGQELRLSAVFEWHQAEFAQAAAAQRWGKGVADFVRGYASPTVAPRIRAQAVRFLRMDWRLNEAPKIRKDAP